MTDDPADGRLLVSVVIPAYFEEKTIGAIVEKCLPFADEVLVINDGSTDDTVKAARAAGVRVASVPISVREREDGERRVQTEHVAQFFIVLRDLLR